MRVFRDDREDYIPSYPNRLICDVLEAMRKCHETRNYSYLPGLIEEAQAMADRMEAALSCQKDIIELTALKSKLIKECKALKERKNASKKRKK